MDILNSYDYGINHPHCIKQTRSFMELGFDLVAPECMAFFREGYLPSGEIWYDTTTWYMSYFGAEASSQLYYPDIENHHLEKVANVNQGLTFMPVQKKPQVNWESAGIKDSSYYDAEREGSYGSGGYRWTYDTFYSKYTGNGNNPWEPSDHIVHMPSLASQFNSAIQQHLKTPFKVNAWGLNHHVVNVMWADLSGLSDNWDKELDFIKDIMDGTADGAINSPRPDLVRFVTMQELSKIYDDVKTNVDNRHALIIPQACYLSQNYPNPFNSQTTISFGLNKPGKVSLKIYNLEGQQVADLVNNRYGVGQYIVPFNAISLPS